MVSNQKLFSVGNFDFRLQHLLVIGVLALSVSLSMVMRSVPASYGLELFEFDPFFNFRATEYILENGPIAYFEWIDEKSWHPFGRNVSETSQVTLHMTAAYLYPIFNFGSSLYNFTVLFPLVIGSLTAIVVFAFVRVLGGTTAGLFGALIFAISVPILMRGLIGWFKSEPLGLFFAFIAMYLFVSGIKFNKGKISFVKLILSGLFLALGLSAWGGILFFIIIVALFYFALPFFNHSKNFLIWATPTFSTSLIIFSLLFERTTEFIIGYAGIAILLPTIFVISTEIIKKFSTKTTEIRNCLLLLSAMIVSGIGIFSAGIVNLPTFRYQNAVNPFLTSQDALVDSVAEHVTTDLSISFTLLSVFMIFAVIGIWFIFSRNKTELKIDMKIFALVTSLAAIYISSSFVRLELFASVAIIILASIGLSILAKHIFQKENQKIGKLVFVVVITVLLVIPLSLPENNKWSSWGDFPPTILYGGTSYSKSISNDWPDAMFWLKNNSPNDAVVAAWWDYGYWITTVSERSTLIDNSTLIDWQIKKMAFALIAPVEQSWHVLGSHFSEDISEHLGDEKIIKFGGQLERDFNLDYTTKVLFDDTDRKYTTLSVDDKRIVDNYISENGTKICEITTKLETKKIDKLEQSCNPITKGMNADYVVIFISGERFYVENSNVPLYTLEGGGDESKKVWFADIADFQVSKYVQSDSVSPTEYFMENSTLGNLIPFSIVTYVEPNTGRTFDKYFDGFVPVYTKNLKLSDPIMDPYFLVYASPAFYDEKPGVMSTVLIYKINSDFIP